MPFQECYFKKDCPLSLRFVHFTWGGGRKRRGLMRKVFFLLELKRLQARVTVIKNNFTVQYCWSKS